jgi:serine/threonine-protein kinase
MRLVENTIVAGRFRLNRPLGAGGMGAVWHATHLGLDIPCAIKFVKGELADQEDMRARFEREAKAAAHLRSPHVVQVLDHGICDGTPYIAMELLDGEDLGTRLERVGRLSQEETYKIMSEACRALAKAHANGIIHRDLKPDNIFIVKDDDREITKVLDFGIAKTLTNELAGSGTKTGAMLGTPYYMSPEQAQGTKAVDLRSDLWSLAVIAFQALTGNLPFESEALGDLLVKIIISPIPIPSQMAAVPAGFDKWWAKAAARDPAERFQSAKEFSDSLALVCGVSHVSGVVDRSQLRVVAADSPGHAAQGHLISAPRALAETPRGTLPTPLASPAARAGSSPQLGLPPDTLSLPGLSAEGTGSTTGTTPAPLSRSFVADPEFKAPSRVGLVVALAFGGLLFAGTLAGVGWLAFRGHGESSAAAGSASSSVASSSPAPSSPPIAASSPAAPAPTPLPVQAPEPAAAAAAPPVVPPPADTPAPPSAPTLNPASGASKLSHGRTKPLSGGASPAKPAKPADMGF